MNAISFKTTITALALLFTINSCKKDEDEFKFPTGDIQLTLEDEAVFTSLEDLENESFYSGENADMHSLLYVGISPDSCKSNVSFNKLKPFEKYYWYVLVRDKKNPDNIAKSEIRSFYYVIAPQITKVYNPEGDWATVLKWEHNDCLKEATVTLTPDKDCQYDKTPIVVSAAQDSCYISAGGEFNTDDQKYTVWHQWWDDSKAQYYEPVIYNFNVTFNGEIDGHTFTLTNDSVKYIFLDRAKYAADKQFNVYRMGQIGNRTWLLEDLRGIQEDMAGSYEVISPLGFKARLYPKKYNEIIPEGFRLSTDEDWLDLEYTYGVGKTKYTDYQYWEEPLINYAMRQSSDQFYQELYEQYSKDTTIYAGVKNQILYKLASKNEWNSADSTRSTLDGMGVFNARPYGLLGYWETRKNVYNGEVVAFLTDTQDEHGYKIIRYLWGGNPGIGRIIYGYGAYYALRCVKNE